MFNGGVASGRESGTAFCVERTGDRGIEEIDGGDILFDYSLIGIQAKVTASESW